jgi:prefoldin subunit 5
VAWNKIKRLFIEEQPGAYVPSPRSDAAVDPGALAADPLVHSDADLAALELPPDKVGSLPPQTDPSTLTGSIDFQALYDQAGIPNTDEVEQLEKFLSGLDDSLPQASRVAAAKAFLGAIGKSSADVITDAGRKIEVVRAVDQAKSGEVSKRRTELQTEIDRLTAEIEKCKHSMEDVNGELESVRSQCTVEESRLQGARIFFGQLGPKT